MARDEDDLTTDQKLDRGVARTIFNWLVALAAIGVIAAWVALRGWVQLEPGDAAVVLKFGERSRVLTDPGLKLLFPAPIEYASTVSISEVRNIEFGVGRGQDEGDQPAEAEGGIAMQTADSNIVMLSYELQYEILDPFSYLFGMANPETTLGAATQSAVREVVGRRGIDEVLSDGRAAIEIEAREILQQTLDSYFDSDERKAPFKVRSIELQSARAPAEVADAFDDVVASSQDGERSASIALGDAGEIRENANAEGSEYREAAQAYKESKILEATGEATRFVALLTEYRRAPEVTRRRLYLETMEAVMPNVEKMVVEPDTVNMMPFLPMPGSGGKSRALPVSSDDGGSR